MQHQICNNKASSSLCLCVLLGTQCCQTNGNTQAEVLQYQLSTQKEKRHLKPV